MSDRLEEIKAWGCVENLPNEHPDYGAIRIADYHWLITELDHSRKHADWLRGCLDARTEERDRHLAVADPGRCHKCDKRVASVETHWLFCSNRPHKYICEDCLKRPRNACERERLGMIVREAWIDWAKTQPAPKESWLIPWGEMQECDREADRVIGERLANEVARPAKSVEPAASSGAGSQLEQDSPINFGSLPPLKEGSNPVRIPPRVQGDNLQ